ncbi:abc transporter substrate-binding protein [Leptolyngbya sp. Heron Island J]|uniref:substrate-binding periplasmic protein n=1 Tax=Leptolyngbya sp. Heron Island J TaxID=1385935 RepID=UPI0003B97B98|nr:transporter substrate-binding domain-containing protein [Leptolyngbya sp. Heron Island J]ESA37601.1 abc transporter substrate-binding protein [Leptolyngbya sp. Heron Island J]
MEPLLKYKLNEKKTVDWSTALMLSLLIPVLAVFFIIYGSSNPQVAETIKPAIFVAGEYSPFSGEMVDEYGIASAVIFEAMKEAGYQAEFKFMPWFLGQEAAYESEVNHDIRGIFPYIKTPDREKDFYFSSPILDVETSIFFNLKNNPELLQFQSFQSLKGYKLLPIEGYRYPPDIQKISQTSFFAKDNVDAFSKLLTNSQVQMVAEATEVGKEVLRENFPRQQQDIQHIPLYSVPFYLMASKKNPSNKRLIEEFDSALRSLGQEGIDKIATRVLNKIDEKRLVILHPFSSDGQLKALFDKQDKNYILLANGTKAVVEMWPDSYLNASISSDLDGLNDIDELVQVRILNGPLRRQILFVDARALDIGGSI